LYERGTGRPAVVLEAGYRSSARIWSEDLHQSGAPRPALDAVADLQHCSAPQAFPVVHTSSQALAGRLFVRLYASTYP